MRTPPQPCEAKTTRAIALHNTLHRLKINSSIQSIAKNRKERRSTKPMLYSPFLLKPTHNNISEYYCCVHPTTVMLVMQFASSCRRTIFSNRRIMSVLKCQGTSHFIVSSWNHQAAEKKTICSRCS